MFNRCQLIGRLGQEPELRFTQNQKAVAQLNVATTEVYKDAAGQRQERTEWHRVIVFGKQAEIARDYLKKGALVLFEGPIRTRKWQDNAGQDRYTTEIHATTLKMLGGKPDPAPQTAPSSAGPGATSKVPPETSVEDYYNDGDNDDIPF